MLKIGQIEYANCVPVFRALQNKNNDYDYTYVKGVPSGLNKLLLNGEIDICPSSSIEYALHQNLYKIIPNISIASTGRVASVLLFSKVPIEKLTDSTVLLSSESATSVNLLKILMHERYGIVCDYKTTGRESGYRLDGNNKALLLIGDEALKSSGLQLTQFVYDLGELWTEWTGLPFVFALWLCRIELASSSEVKQFIDHLYYAKKISAENIEQIAAQNSSLAWFDKYKLVNYWRECISYNLGEHEICGLKLFYSKCFNAGLINANPQLEFI